MSFIYRLETADGTGVFSCGAMSNVPEEARERAYSHPGPMDLRERAKDGHYPLLKAIRSDRELVFGCVSITQLRSWFSRAACRELSAEGVRLRVYRREHCEGLVRGRMQCVFRRPSMGANLPAAHVWNTVRELEGHLRQTETSL